MENKKIHHLMLLVFSIFGLVNYFLIKNNIVADNLRLLFFCFFMILILGVSHGSLDHFRGKNLFQPMLKKNWFIFFYPGYILLSLIVIFCWTLFPVITLLLFLMVASYHFGEEDLRFFFNSKGYFFNLVSLLKGFLIITLSFHYSHETTVVFFEYLMVPQIEYEKLSEFKSLLFSANLIFLIVGLIYLLKKQINKLVLILLEIIFIIMSFIYLPLILAFSMYFCFLHSSKHIIGLANELDSQNISNGLKLFVIKAIPLTFLTAICAFLSIYFLDQNINKNIIQVIFIGLASLTLPHILLEILDRRNE
tara:strand:+ start:2471 stop:3391 length:921 start_codon:yes stop_codon:yes gene_type:complete